MVVGIAGVGSTQLLLLPQAIKILALRTCGCGGHRKDCGILNLRHAHRMYVPALGNITSQTFTTNSLLRRIPVIPFLRIYATYLVLDESSTHLPRVCA